MSAQKGLSGSICGLTYTQAGQEKEILDSAKEKG